jgi:hypothetical protein
LVVWLELLADELVSGPGDVQVRAPALRLTFGQVQGIGQLEGGLAWS